ncbi:hypothetical protein [Xylocopilactobacillus apis]|uniref:Lipoprotein n=1 Tax=Xylocopilactobacillus apis TaxID=2932183 RepID=A0AAU9CXA1_9LACO|nr:hypothetical protein [Xylocopilactobacillus apis]BDR57021.1 hypothetical protein KIMC2_15830 [Xylocopilactobacillus apis]
MKKNIKGLILLLGSLMVLTGCQKKSESTSEKSSSVAVSREKTESNSSSEKDNSNSKPEIVKLSVKDYKKKIYAKKLKDLNKYNGEVIFFETPGNKKSDQELKKIAAICQKKGKTLYTVDISTKEGKDIPKQDERIVAPYDLIVLMKGKGKMYIDLQEKYDRLPPNKVLEDFIAAK